MKQSQMGQNLPMLPMNQPLSRDIVLSGEINERTAGHIINLINEINNEDQDNEDQLKNYKRTPIKLWINSPGGVVYDAFAIIDAIEFSVTPVITLCFGKAMSAAFVIFLAGLQRVAGKMSTFMYHEVWSGWGDKLEGIKLETNELERIQNMTDEYIKTHTKITQEQMNEIRRTKSEWYMNAKEAVDLGVAFVLADTMYDNTKTNVQTQPAKKYKVKNGGEHLHKNNTQNMQQNAEPSQSFLVSRYSLY